MFTFFTLKFPKKNNKQSKRWYETLHISLMLLTFLFRWGMYASTTLKCTVHRAPISVTCYIYDAFWLSLSLSQLTYKYLHFIRLVKCQVIVTYFIACIVVQKIHFSVDCWPMKIFVFVHVSSWKFQHHLKLLWRKRIENWSKHSKCFRVENAAAKHQT